MDFFDDFLLKGCGKMCWFVGSISETVTVWFGEVAGLWHCGF